MHEFSICQSMLNQVNAIATEHGARSVSRITLRIGPISGVEPSLLSEAFNIARGGTIADNAELTIETQVLRVHCETCGEVTDATINRLLCSACGDYHTQLISGDELLLASVEMEND